jgi:hypothetical protein
MKAKKTSLFCLAIVALVLLLSACSGSIGTTGSTSQSNLSVLQVLQNSATAMSKLKSAHIDLKASGSGQAVNSGVTPTPTIGTTPGGTPTAVPPIATPSTATPTSTTQQVTFNVTGSGDEALPNDEAMRFNVTQSVTNTPTSFAQIVQGNNVYVQNAQGKWYVFNKSAFSGYVSKPFSGFGTPNLTQLLGLLVHTKISDHGDETLNGMTVRHISIALDKVALQQMLSSDSQLASLLGQQNINAVLNNTKSVNASIDLWIDETQFYLRQTELKLNLNVNAASLGQSLTPVANSGNTGLIPANVITSLDSTVDLSKFNQPVTIVPPTNATPATNPSTVIG